MAKHATPALPADLPEADRHQVRWVDLGDLLLDSLNPRLPEGMENASQGELLSTLAKDYDLQDVGQSVADHGYFAEEPLVAVKERGQKWTVVEGNRRLAALLLLEHPTSAPRELRERWSALSLERKIRVTKVPTLEYSVRGDITAYLGFRHVTGVLPWRPYPKARFIAQLVERDKLTFAQIARTIGSRSPTVREHYVAFTMVRQARDQFLIDTSNAEISFGVLRRSLSDPNIREYIGLDLDKKERELAKPLPSPKATAVKEFFKWAFGTEGIEPALSDSRDLAKLGAVLAQSRSVAVLRSTNNLDYAFALSGGEERKLVESLDTASYHLDQALPLSIRHNKSRDVIASLKRCQETLKEIVRHFPAVANS